MPSADVATYFGIDLVDLDAQNLMDRALAAAAVKLPEWTPREHNTEVVLLELMAAMVEDVGYRVNAIPDVVTEVLLRAHGVSRDTGAPPVADIWFTVSDDAGHTIPEGTTVRVALGSGDHVDLVTVSDLTIDPGSSWGTVTATGTAADALANGVPAGTVTEVLDAVGYVESAVLASPVTGGRSPEDGDAFLARAAPLLARRTTTLVMPNDVAAFMAEQPEVSALRVLDLYNPDNDTLGPGQSPGFVTVAVLGPGGVAHAPSGLTELTGRLSAKMHAGLRVSVINADITPITLAVAAFRARGSDPVAVAAAIDARIAAYFDPTRWGWEPMIFGNDVLADLDRAEGVDRIDHVLVNSASGNYPLPGYAPVPEIAQVIITVLDPA